MFGTKEFSKDLTRKEKKILIFVKIVENPTPNLWKFTCCPKFQPLGYYYKNTTQGMYLYLNCGNFENFSLKLLNLIF